MLHLGNSNISWKESVFDSGSGRKHGSMLSMSPLVVIGKPGFSAAQPLPVFPTQLPLAIFSPRQVWSTSGAVQGRPQNGFKRNSFLRLPSKKRLANSWTVTLLWMPFLTETYILSWTDIPRNLRVVEDVRGNLQSHELDVICMVKRYASNDCLEQDLCLIVSLLKFQYWKKHTYTWMNILCRTLCCTNHAQDV